MKITLAKTAGFCFGVNRAVDIVEKLAESGEKVCTLGPIIHNAQLVKQLEDKGVRIINTPNEAESDEVLVIRSHGVTAEVEEDCEKFAKRVENATCPFVSKIHKIVSEKSQNGYTTIIAGDKNHQEVKGIIGNCFGEYFVVQDLVEVLIYLM